MSTKNIIHAGLDVDDTAFHGAGIIRETGEIFELKCKPDHGVLSIFTPLPNHLSLLSYTASTISFAFRFRGV
jgi:hypothetical protein